MREALLNQKPADLDAADLAWDADQVANPRRTFEIPPGLPAPPATDRGARDGSASASSASDNLLVYTPLESVPNTTGATMTFRFNPFRPGKTVHPAMFAGRLNEVELIEKYLHQTRNGNPAHFMLIGARGIGKSSLLLYTDVVSRMGFTPELKGPDFKFATLNLTLDPSVTQASIAKRLVSELRREIDERRKAVAVLAKVWEFASKWEVMGVKYEAGNDEVDSHEIVASIAEGLHSAERSAGTAIDGLLVLIDEADKAPDEARLGEFLKLLTERLTTIGCERVCLGLSGLPRLPAHLGSSHESAPRVFSALPLRPLTDSDCRDAVNLGLKVAAAKNGQPTAITDEALARLAVLSEGYPNYLQQFAYDAFDHDSDWSIDAADLDAAEQRTYEQLGTHYFHDMCYGQVQSEAYRAVLRAMASHHADWVPKTQLRKEAGITDSKLTNAINALLERSLILPKDGEKGIYRLPTRAFAKWLREYDKTRGS